jgi:predicted acetyltransferase
MSDFRVERAEKAQQPLIEAMLQLYTHDFSEHWAGTPRGELGEDGRFPPYPLDDYWREEGRVPLLFRKAGLPVGFALLNRYAHSGLPVDVSMAEFFVVRKHRREGLGRIAFDEILARHSGAWEVAVVRRNLAALDFWQRVLDGARTVTGFEARDHRDARWDGTIFRFRVG